MKQYTKLLFIIAAVLAMFSCKEKEFGCISTDVTDFVFDHKASEQSRVVDGGYDLRASSDQSWCAATLSGDGEYSLSVRVLANTDREARYANVTLSAAGCGNVTLKVVQGGLDDSKEPYLVADRTKIETKDVAHILFVTVSSNRDDVQIVSHPDWCVPELLADKETENLRLDFSANTSDKNRTGEVVLGATGCEDLVVNVVQSRLLSKECDLLTFGLKASGNSLEKDIDFGFDKEERTLKAMYLKWIDKSEPAMLVPTFTMTRKRLWWEARKSFPGRPQFHLPMISTLRWSPRTGTPGHGVSR